MGRPLGGPAILVACALVLGGPHRAASQPGELRVGVPRLSPVLDPATALEGTVPLVARQVFDTLVQYRQGSSDVEAGLAVSWRTSRDGLAWIFTLRQGVTLHDGTPLTAQHVAASLARLLSAGEAAPAPNAAARLIRGAPGVVRAVRALDTRTVEIRLVLPYAPLLTALAHPAFGIAVRGPGSDGRPGWLGTGPFRISEVAPGRLVLDASPSHWKGPPRVGRIVFVEEGDDGRGEALVEQGTLDLWFPARPPSVTTGVASVPGWRVGYLAMHSERDPFRARAVRRAVAAALVPDLIAAAVEPWAVPLRTFLPPGVFGRLDRPVWGEGAERARRLLAQGGHRAGFSAALLVPAEGEGPEGTRLGEAIRRSLEAVGAAVAIVVEPPDALRRIAQRAEHEMVLLEALVEGGDPHFLLYPLSSAEGAQQGPWGVNLSFYRNPRLDDLLIRASQLAFRAERARVYARAQALLAEEAPWLPLYARAHWVVARPEVRDLRLHPSGHHLLSGVWLESR